MALLAAVGSWAGPLLGEPVTTARIDSVQPTMLDSRGGQLATLSGVFRPPVRVFFDLGQGLTPFIEAFVVSTTPTSVVVITPAVDVDWRLANLIVVAPAGSASEQRSTLANAVRFVRAGLPPSINFVSPRAVPRTGGTLTFIGAGFESPLRVFSIHADGSETEMQVFRVAFDQVTVFAPGGDINESLGVHVVNVLTGKSSTFPDAFRYVTPMSITSVTPAAGPYTGGTQVTIEGSGFADHVAVVIGGVPAQPLETTEHEIIAMTGSPTGLQCSDSTGVVNVTNVDDGIDTVGAPFTFTTPRSEFRFVPSEATAGSVVNVIVKNDADRMRFLLNDTPIQIASRVENGDGSATYRLGIPSRFVFSAGHCLPEPVALTLRMTNPDTGCRDTRPLFVIPAPNSGRCRPPRELP
jgi:hypothetical protein